MSQCTLEGVQKVVCLYLIYRIMMYHFKLLLMSNKHGLFVQIVNVSWFLPFCAPPKDVAKNKITKITLSDSLKRKSLLKLKGENWFVIQQACVSCRHPGPSPWQAVLPVPRGMQLAVSWLAGCTAGLQPCLGSILQQLQLCGQSRPRSFIFIGWHVHFQFLL